MSNAIQDILSREHADPESAEYSLSELREVLITAPCPAESRGKVWKLLLRVNQISAASYIHLVELGPSYLDDKIRQDTFRTMSTDPDFVKHVPEDMLIRVLNAFIWTGNVKERPDFIQQCFGRSSMSCVTYVQGMNVMAAPFLIAMSEMEAFFSFSTLLWKWCPLYVQPTMKGVHCGLRLLDLCLRSVDPTLYGYLRGKNLSASTYAFASVMTFSACTPPLSEVLLLWDYMFAYGLHLNILFIIAQLALIRTDLLNHASPVNLLRVLPPLRAKAIINLTVPLCKNLPEDLYDKLVRHSYDESVSDELGIKPTNANWTGQDDAQDLPAYMLDALDMKKLRE